MKIKSLKLNNYRSFIGENIISFDNSGKNIFIQGENGSGKSSICKSLNDFFEASDKRKTLSLATNTFRNPFSNTTENVKKLIEIQFTDGTIYTFTENGFESPEFEVIANIRRLKGFLEYKNLLPIYLYSNRKSKNLFRLFVEGPFAKLRNPITGRNVENEWDSDKKDSLTPEFHQGVFQLAKALEETVNLILKYFDPSIIVKFTTRKVWTTGALFLEVRVNGRKLLNYGDYFNEAKLVALSISIYLAVILKQKEQNGLETCKLLILDDIFIGMDMSNRIPLLKVIGELFDDYQIVITSFDENWFRLSRFYLTTEKWKFFKVFSKFEKPHIPKSFIYDNTIDNYIEKANHFFESFDYPTCANYLRKAFEKQFKELLPYNLSHCFNEEGEIKPNSKLNTNFENLIKFLSDSKLDTDSLVDFSLYTKILLNPLSHDNLESPIYKRELESAFLLFERLQLINKKPLKEVNSKTSNIFKLSVKNQNDIWFQYKYELVDNLYRITFDKNIGYSKSRVICVASKTGGSEWVEVQDGEKISLENEYERICILHGTEIQDYTTAYRTNKDLSIAEL